MDCGFKYGFQKMAPSFGASSDAWKYFYHFTTCLDQNWACLPSFYLSLLYLCQCCALLQNVVFYTFSFFLLFLKYVFSLFSFDFLLSFESSNQKSLRTQFGFINHFEKCFVRTDLKNVLLELTWLRNRVTREFFFVFFKKIHFIVK